MIALSFFVDKVGEICTNESYNLGVGDCLPLEISLYIEVLVLRYLERVLLYILTDGL